MAASSRGHQALMGMSPSYAFNGDTASAVSVSLPIQFRNESVRKIATHIQTEGITGASQRIADDVCDGTYRVSGSILIVPKPVMLDGLLNKIQGAAEVVTDLFNPAEALPEFVLQIDRKLHVYAYDHCVVSRARFFSSKGQPLLLELGVEGRKAGAHATTTFTAGSPGAAGTFPTLTLETLQPYMHHQLVFTIGGEAYECDNFELIIDNVLDTERFNNSQTRTELPKTDRIVTVRATFPYTSTEALELTELATAGVAATAQFTRGARSLLFTFGKLQKPDEHPVVEGPQSEITQTITFNARKVAGTGAGLATSATHDCTATNDTTP